MSWSTESASATVNGRTRFNVPNQAINPESCDPALSGVHLLVVSAGPGRVQRWLVGYVERWEDDAEGYVSKNFLRMGWHLHESADREQGEHPIQGLTYTVLDGFDTAVSSHSKQRSHRESARRAIAGLCQEGTFEESADTRSVRLPVLVTADGDLARRLSVEREYLKAHGQSASDELLVAITGNIVVIELDRQLSLKERMSFQTRCLERGDSPSDRLQHLVDYVATKHGIPREQALGDAFHSARRLLTQWREENQ